jgi:hypothetical protein
MRFEERTMQASVVGHSARTRRGQRMRAACRWAPVGLVVVLGVLLVRDVAARGGAGHQIICEFAFQEFTPQARAAVQQLLQHEADFSTFSKACPWPAHPRKRASEHFVNLPRAATHIGDEPCPLDAPCVVTAIAADFAALSRAGATDAEKLTALKSLGH